MFTIENDCFGFVGWDSFKKVLLQTLLLGFCFVHNVILIGPYFVYKQEKRLFNSKVFSAFKKNRLLSPNDS